MMLDWQKLLSSSRHGSSPRKPTGDRRRVSRSEFEADYDRAIYSSSFRRLGKKTQVHPMERNAHIHNRLTHSLEVASVARSFGRRLGHLLETKGVLPEPLNEYDIAFSLMAAALAHDIGMPESSRFENGLKVTKTSFFRTILTIRLSRQTFPSSKVTLKDSV
jgi:dGTPase